MPASSSQITLVGLGNMGAALARAQLKAGASITVWNRTKEKSAVTDLISAGARFQQDLGEAIAASPLVIFCVLDYPTLYEMLDPLPKTNGPLHGRTIVNLTNGTPQDAREMDTWMQERAVAAYLDGGIMAGPDMIGSERAFVFYSGASQAAFESLTSTLQIFGRPEYHGTDPGAAALLDVSLLAGMYGMLQGTLVAMALLRIQFQGKETTAKEATGSMEQKVTSLLNPFLQAFMAGHVQIARAVDHDDRGAHGHPMEMRAVAMQNVARACNEEGVDATVFKHFFGLVQGRVERGGGKDGIVALLDDFMQRRS